MKRLALAFLILAAAPLSAGSVAIAKHAALATASPYATRIGLSVLKRGGNAIDAAVAVAFALSVAEPQSGGIGGGGFLTYYDAEKRAVWTLDFREVAPGAATRNMFEGGASATRGPLAAGVPGTVAGLQAMHDRFGSRPWRELVMPAVGLTQGKKDLAATLERIAGKGASDVYEGETASRIVESVRKAGGIIGLRDLREYKPIWRAPIRITFREFDIYAVPPPSAAGLMIGEQLHILSAYDLRTTGDQTASTVHLLAEAARRAASSHPRAVVRRARQTVARIDRSPARNADALFGRAGDGHCRRHAYDAFHDCRHGGKHRRADHEPWR
jgi:gamma-glutamyltranspeptidase/glutathione hydrolase